jgi:16S rRNA (cytosine1402-N4)-methyltransferase
MNATIKLENEKHFPVLLDKLISIISPLYGGTFIDCTFGQGGYSKKILENKYNNIIAIDRDAKSLKISNKFEKIYKKRFKFTNIKFSQINNIKLNKNILKGIIFDLGCSINQIKDPDKGLSFLYNGKLNMKMGLNDISAHDVINSFNQASLSKIFYSFGEEKKSKYIAKKIINLRKTKNIDTQDLVKIIDSTYKNKYKKIHNSTKVFQALRIFVNKEISELINGLINSFKLIPKGGVIAVVTFHSIEDKIVKYFFHHYSQTRNSSRYLPEREIKNILFKLTNKKALLPDKSEILKNPPSRSAKLRFAFKIDEHSDFSDFKEKFKYLLDIENLQ